MNIKKLLPIGSVVLLKEGKKRLMIYGILQKNKNEEKEFDYVGVLYPEGHIGNKFQYLFNHEDIEEIVFRGFEDAERENFLEKLSQLY